jgi:hypothetical protein
MIVPFTDLDAAVRDLETAVAENETVDESAITLISGFSDVVKTAVTEALQDDDAADEGSIQAAQAAIASATARMTASSAKLGAAVVANTPAAPPTE